VISVLLIVVGFTLVSGQVGQAYAAYHYGGHHGYVGGHHGYYGGGYSYSWYYPYYYYSYGYCYSPYYGYYGYYDYGCSSYSYSQPTQYQLTVSTDPASLSNQVTGGGSYNQGSTVTVSASQNMIQVSKDTRYIFSHWSGDYTGTSLNASFTMDGSKTVTAVYQVQYYLTVTVQPSNAPSLQGDGWYNAGETVPLTVPSQIVGGTDGTRLVFNGWNVDGSNQAGPAVNIQMSVPHTAIAQYKQQYYLTVSTSQGVPSGEGWYDAGALASINVSTPPNPSFGVKYIFDGWQGGVQSSSQSTQVIMNGPKTVTATWTTDATLLYATIGAILLAILLVAGAGLYAISRRKQGTAA